MSETTPPPKDATPQPPLPAELMAFAAAASKALASTFEIPAEFGGASFYISSATISWTYGGDTEHYGELVPNDFEGYDYQPNFRRDRA